MGEAHSIVFGFLWHGKNEKHNYIHFKKFKNVPAFKMINARTTSMVTSERSALIEIYIAYFCLVIYHSFYKHMQ